LSQYINQVQDYKNSFVHSNIDRLQKIIEMKSYHIEAFNTIDGILARQQPTPEPGPYDILIKVKTVSLNRRDILILNQAYPLPARPGIIPISDGAGEVVAIGEKVSKFRIGQRVSGNYFPRWRDGLMRMDIMDQLGCTLDGMLSEFALLHEDWLVGIPEHLTWEEAATLPCSALTAWSALTGPRSLSPGDTVLTIGSGGVSLFVIQFARLFGAKVVVLTTRDEKVKRLKTLGADHVVNYRADPKWSDSVLALTEGRGVDRIIETGGIETMEESVKAIAFGGEIALVTPMGISRKPGIDSNKLLVPLFVRLVNLRPIFVGSRLSFEQMNRAVASHQLHPLVDRAFSFEEVKEAYHYFDKGEHIGKVIIKVSRNPENARILRKLSPNFQSNLPLKP
jgi:NADPH:quinone reductase-like Zn-dependent oxidoreductase